MPRHQCSIAHYIFRSTDLQDLLNTGLERAENTEALARKLLSDFLKDANYEMVRGLHFDPREDAWIADVALFIEADI